MRLGYVEGTKDKKKKNKKKMGEVGILWRRTGKEEDGNAAMLLGG